MGNELSKETRSTSEDRHSIQLSHDEREIAGKMFSPECALHQDIFNISYPQ